MIDAPQIEHRYLTCMIEHRYLTCMTEHRYLTCMIDASQIEHRYAGATDAPQTQHIHHQ